MVGKCSVEIVEIGEKREPTGDMQGKCIPDKDNITGTPMVKRANGNSVRISSHQQAYFKKPVNLNGCDIYTADHWTAYH